MPGLRHTRNLDTPDARVRTCLKGDHPFLSEGPWNRICPKCVEAQGRGPDARFAPTRGRQRSARAGSHDARTG